MIQFLRENGLTNTAKTLEEESQLRMNTLDNLDGFIKDIKGMTQKLFLSSNKRSVVIKKIHIKLTTFNKNVKNFGLEGHWDLVLKMVQNLSLPIEKLANLYEQIILEFIELKELDTARHMLRKTPPMIWLKNEKSDRITRIEKFISEGGVELRDVSPILSRFEIEEMVPKKKKLFLDLVSFFDFVALWRCIERKKEKPNS